jgi:hypothetical protein
MDQDERRDIEIERLFGMLMAQDVALTALLRAMPDREGLARAWRDAEDLGFTWTSEANGAPSQRHESIQRAYLQALADIRERMR